MQTTLSLRRWMFEMNLRRRHRGPDSKFFVDVVSGNDGQQASRRTQPAGHPKAEANVAARRSAMHSRRPRHARALCTSQRFRRSVLSSPPARFPPLYLWPVDFK